MNEQHDTTDSTDEEPALDSGGGVAVAEAPAAPAPSKKNWYVIKVQSGREDSIKAAIERRVKMDGMEGYFGRIYIPTEKFTEVRNGKRITKHRKKLAGYLMAEVEYNESILMLFRETSGVGDFLGGSLHRAPLPMSPIDVQKMMGDEVDDEIKESAGIKSGGKIKIPYGVGDKVKVRDGTFAGMEGEVKEILEPTDAKENPRVKVVLSIWGRPVDVDVEYWQVDPV